MHEASQVCELWNDAISSLVVELSNTSPTTLEIPESSDLSEIPRLPEEVMRQILDNLDYKSMLQCSQVCKLWHDIISKSRKFLDSMNFHLQVRTTQPLTIDWATKHRYLEEADSTFSYGLPYLTIDNLGVISSVSENLVSLRFTSPKKVVQDTIRWLHSVLSRFELLALLQSCVNLKELYIKKYPEILGRGDWIYLISQVNVKLPKLTHLTLDDCDWLLDYFFIDNLESLRDLRHKNACNPAYIIKFLKRLQHVDDIELRSVNLRSAIDSNFVPHFKWKSLKLSHLDFIGTCEHTQNNWQILFYVAQQDAEIEMGEKVHNFSARPLLEMIMHQPRITRMKLELMSYPKRFLTNEPDEKFQYVKELKIRRCMFENGKFEEDLDVDENALLKMEEIMRRFDNVEILDMDFECAKFIYNNDPTRLLRPVFQNVKHLKIDSLSKCFSMLSTVTFPSLETLELISLVRERKCSATTVENVHRNNNLHDEFQTEANAGRNNPTLKKLIVHYEGKCQDIQQDTWQLMMGKFSTVQEFEIFNPAANYRVVMKTVDIVKMIEELKKNHN